MLGGGAVKLLKKKDNGSIIYEMITLILIVTMIAFLVTLLHERQIKSIKLRCDNDVITASLAANKVDIYSLATNYNILLDTGSLDGSVTYGNVVPGGSFTEQFRTASFKAYDVAYNCFCDALKTNMSLDNDFKPIKKMQIISVKIVDFRIYNVCNNDVFEIKKIDGSYSVEAHADSINNFKTPSNDIVGASGLYVKVEVTINNSIKKSTSKFDLTSYVDSKQS